MYHNRRTIVKAKKMPQNVVPFDASKRLKKGFRYTGNGQIKDKQGNVYQITDYK